VKCGEGNVNGAAALSEFGEGKGGKIEDGRSKMEDGRWRMEDGPYAHNVELVPRYGEVRADSRRRCEVRRSVVRDSKMADRKEGVT
jgi:hypothetical protein